MSFLGDCVAHAIIPMQMIRLTTSTSKTDITWGEGVQHKYCYYHLHIYKQRGVNKLYSLHDIVGNMLHFCLFKI